MKPLSVTGKNGRVVAMIEVPDEERGRTCEKEGNLMPEVDWSVDITKLKKERTRVLTKADFLHDYALWSLH